MHEKFLITLYLLFCKVNFHIKWGSALGICFQLPICLFILSTMIRRKVLSPLKPSPKNSFWLATFAIYYRNMQIHLFFTLFLGLLSPPNISFSAIRKVRKFLLSLCIYWIQKVKIIWLEALKGPGGLQPITNYWIKHVRTPFCKQNDQEKGLTRLWELFN
jgi:hypothetical protein